MSNQPFFAQLEKSMKLCAPVTPKPSDLYNPVFRAIREFCPRKVSYAFVPATGYFILSIPATVKPGFDCGVLKSEPGKRVYQNGVWLEKAMRHLFPEATDLSLSVSVHNETVSFRLPHISARND